MNKKIIAVISAVSLLSAMSCTMYTHAESDTSISVQAVYKQDNVQYEYDIQGGRAVITKIISEQEVIKIPDTLNSYPVTEIGNNAMSQGIIKVRRIEIPSGVTKIGDNAFSKLKRLNEITLPDGLISLGRECFRECESLGEIIIPDSVTSIGKNCFWKCYSLKEVKLPNKITKLDSTFSNCQSLKSITIPETVTSMTGGTFAGCTMLEDVVWNSDNIENISDMEFYDTKWILDNSQEYILTDNGKNFYKYTGDKDEFTIPDGVEKIQYCAFQQSGNGKNAQECTLTKITVPSSISEIGEQAFMGAEKLETVVFEGDILKIGKNAFRNCGFAEFTVPDSVQYINEGAFGSCTNLKKIVLSSQLKSIGDECFSGCTSLSDIELPESLVHIGTKVFKDCSSLKKLNIPDGIAGSVNKNTFYAFSVENVDYNGKITNDIYESLPKKAWEKTMGDDEEFVIVDGVLKSYNGNDKHISIPEGVKEISKRAFFEKEFETVDFPSSLEKIGELAFYATPITEVTIPTTVKIVGEMSFAQCPNLKKVVVENGVGQIDALAFAYCNLLDDITIGESVKAAKNAFDDTPYRYGISAEEYNSPNWEAPTGIVPMPTPKPSIEPKPTEEPKPSEKLQLAVKSENGILGVSVDGKAVEFGMAKPFIDKHDRTQIPVRAVSEMIGSDVEWDGDNKIVTVKHDNDVIKLTIGSDVMYVNGEAVKMDTQAVIVDDRTYIPIRYIGEMIGCEVVYEGE